jgi:hypothetical protein
MTLDRMPKQIHPFGLFHTLPGLSYALSPNTRAIDQLRTLPFECNDQQISDSNNDVSL